MADSKAGQSVLQMVVQTAALWAHRSAGQTADRWVARRAVSMADSKAGHSVPQKVAQTAALWARRSAGQMADRWVARLAVEMVGRWVDRRAVSMADLKVVRSAVLTTVECRRTRLSRVVLPGFSVSY